MGYQGPHGAHVHGSIGVDSVPTLHVLHLCGVHVLHLQREASASHRGDWVVNRGKPGEGLGAPTTMTTSPPIPHPAILKGSTALCLCCIVNVQHVVAPISASPWSVCGLELGSQTTVALPQLGCSVLCGIPRLLGQFQTTASVGQASVSYAAICLPSSYRANGQVLVTL